MLDIKGVSITSNIFYNLVREHTKVALLKQIQSNEKWDDDTAATISWQSTSLVVKRIDREVVITKACHGILPTMQVLHKMKQSSIKKCPICLHTESQEHMLLCNNVLQKKLRRTLVKNLRIEMKKKRTGHALIDHLCSVATEWLDTGAVQVDNYPPPIQPTLYSQAKITTTTTTTTTAAAAAAETR